MSDGNKEVTGSDRPDDAPDSLEIGRLIEADRPPTVQRQEVPDDPHADGGVRRGDAFHWGLVPRWAKDESIGSRMINARAETAAEKPGFRDALRRRRCIVPASGFYEWKATPEGRKQPYMIRRRDGRPLALAGLWERWSPPEAALPGMEADELETCAIITTTPVGAVKALHDRMPLILGEADFDGWLGDAEGARVRALLGGAPAPDELEAFPVSTRVNSVRNDDAACAAPAE